MDPTEKLEKDGWSIRELDENRGLYKMMTQGLTTLQNELKSRNKDLLKQEASSFLRHIIWNQS